MKQIGKTKKHRRNRMNNKGYTNPIIQSGFIRRSEDFQPLSGPALLARFKVVILIFNFISFTPPEISGI